MTPKANQKSAQSLIEQDALITALTPVAGALIRAKQSAGALLHAAKLAFLHAAVAEMRGRKERPNVSRLSVITGMTRKEISSLLKAASVTAAERRPSKHLEHRALRVLRGWKTDPRFSDDGRPRELPAAGEGKSFATLVRAYGGDVPAMAVLRELEQMNAVRRTKSGKLRPRTRSAVATPVLSERFDEFTRLLADFSETAAERLFEDEPRVYLGFKEILGMEEKQIARFKSSFARRAATLLEGVEHWNATLVRARSRSMAAHGPESRRIGLGVYLFDRRSARLTSAGRKS